MAMAPEAGQNFLSGNKQRLSFTLARPAGHTGRLCSLGTEDPREGHGGCRAFLLSAALGDSRGVMKPPPKARPGGALVWRALPPLLEAQ